MSAALLPLRGMACTTCGFVSVPTQTFGCENCGAHDADFVGTEFSGRGTVLAAVTVYQHPRDDLELPMRVGSVHLEEGPVVRARVGSDVKAGERVVATDDAGSLVFQREGTR